MISINIERLIAAIVDEKELAIIKCQEMDTFTVNFLPLRLIKDIDSLLFPKLAQGNDVKQLCGALEFSFCDANYIVSCREPFVELVKCWYKRDGSAANLKRLVQLLEDIHRPDVVALFDDLDLTVTNDTISIVESEYKLKLKAKASHSVYIVCSLDSEEERSTCQHLLQYINSFQDVSATCIGGDSESDVMEKSSCAHHIVFVCNSLLKSCEQNMFNKQLPKTDETVAIATALNLMAEHVFKNNSTSKYLCVLFASHKSSNRPSLLNTSRFYKYPDEAQRIRKRILNC